MNMISKIYYVIFGFVLMAILCSSEKTEEHHESDEHHDTEHKDDHSDSSHEHYDKSGHHDESYDHDAVTGSHHESEEFKDLEPEEAKRRLGLLFDKIDIDKDSFINQTELYQWILNSFQKLDLEDAGSKMHEMDENNDKSVSWGEFLTKTYGHSENEINDMLKTNTADMKGFIDGVLLDKKKFQLADRNNDSFLDIHEFAKFSHPHNYPEMSSFELEKTLDDFDKNKDGGIDLKEFIGNEKIDSETETHEKKSFLEFDKDKNGLLQGSEIMEWVMPGFEKTTTNEVEHLFNETDVNKDKLLSKEEIVNQHELWVGSHATDYGKHLDDLKHREEL